jgi:hypothetical protein
MRTLEACARKLTLTVSMTLEAYMYRRKRSLDLIARV